MKNLVSDWLIQLVWFLAGICATGAFWYFLSRDDIVSTILSGLAAAAFAIIAIYLHRLNDRSSRYRAHREKLASFIKEAHAILARLNEQPLPIGDYNEWVERVVKFLTESLDESYAVRFNDFSGMTFYGDGSERSRLKNAIDGRIRRLNEFLPELNQ